MTFQQIEYLIHGDILQFSINDFRISDKLILQKVYGDGYQDSTWGEHTGHVKAFVGVEFDEKGNYFKRADDYLTLFLHLYTLETGQPYVKFSGGVSINLDDLSNLGVKKIDSFHGFNQIEYLSPPRERDMILISNRKAVFEELECEYEALMSSPFGLSLQFFYDAVMANHRRRLELAVVNFMIAAETLVIKEDRSHRQLVSKRIGVLASEKPDEIDEVYREMKRLYGVRSAIVHGGGKKASPYDVQALFRYLKKGIQKRLLLRETPKVELVRKLIEVFDDRTLFDNLLTID